jgi:hypothetical protein
VVRLEIVFLMGICGLIRGTLGLQSLRRGIQLTDFKWLGQWMEQYLVSDQQLRRLDIEIV